MQAYGTTAQRVLRNAEVPVLLLCQAPAGRSQRVLLTTDLSEISAGVHEHGLDTVEALFDEPQVRSLLVVKYDVPIPVAGLRKRAADTAHCKLQQFLVERTPRAWRVEAGVRFGTPAKEIVAEAEDWQADLLVLGTHAHTKAGHHLLGSVAATAVSGALCNVLIIPVPATHSLVPDALAPAASAPLATL